MAKKSTTQNKKPASRKGAKSKKSPLIGWLPIQQIPETPLKLVKRKKVVGTVGEKAGPRLHLGGLAARIVLTGLLIELGILLAPRVLSAAPPWGGPVSVDDACALRQWTGNEVIDPHWPSIRRWCPAIMSAGTTYDLDPYLLAALILQESGGQPDIVSRSGAVGLMQVMPRDGLAADFQCPAGPCFAARPSIDELKDPDFNIDYGARLLATNAARTGSIREALRAYGPLDVGYRYADGVLGLYDKIKQ